jgi:coniferyl-aldehyde dehydrogenase
VLSVYRYDDIHEVIEYVNTRPSPLAAYWYGGDSDEFRLFLDHTTSGGVARNDGLIHASLHGAGFGGVGNSGTGAYHGKAGFDEFTHRRTVAVADESKGVSDGLVGRILVTEEFMGMVDLGITASIASIKARLGK